ncbi:hypothetical protein PY092_13360 [Muricauda sp. 334s03]|uniref:Uncharacterized protein n=1 Tax=Flagellimonas yonaguniensis TaxID=3031325 RepID=A0ABT5Y171_9FLAO|nr:hypothetical protein [[Muricauda] yonaguniensis]
MYIKEFVPLVKLFAFQHIKGFEYAMASNMEKYNSLGKRLKYSSGGNTIIV